MKKFMFLRRPLCFWITISFVSTLIIPPQRLYAQTVLDLPAPGTMVSLSPSFEPALIKGLTVHKDNPFLFDFIVDPGQSKLSKEVLKDESERMIKYFFAALTIPDKDIWVNLSPYEKDRMIPQTLGKTAMGRDLLAQDYMLKQLTASLIYPQKALGKTFWQKVYSKAKEMYGTTQVPVNTFNKVWIVPQKAGIYEHNQTAFIVSGHLKVMLEEDYLSLSRHSEGVHSTTEESKGALRSFANAQDDKIHALGSQIIRQIILPEIEKEVNEGKNFATLRQIFYAQVLAVWFKRNLKQALLNQVYANKGTIKGIDQNDTATNEAIYHQYLRAYKKGVFNFIQEDPIMSSPNVPPGRDPAAAVTSIGDPGHATIARKYFSGGYANLAQLSIDPAQLSAKAMASIKERDVDFAVLAVRPEKRANAAMNSVEVARKSFKKDVLEKYPQVFTNKDALGTELNRIVEDKDMAAFLLRVLNGIHPQTVQDQEAKETTFDLWRLFVSSLENKHHLKNEAMTAKSGNNTLKKLYRQINEVDPFEKLWAWAEEHRGQTIDMFGWEISEISKVPLMHVSIILRIHQIQTKGKEVNQELALQQEKVRKETLKWMEERRGQILDMTQQEIADIIGTSQTNVSKYLPFFDIQTRGDQRFFGNSVGNLPQASETAYSLAPENQNISYEKIIIWAKKHRGQIVNMSVRKIAAKYNVPFHDVITIRRVFHIQTKGNVLNQTLADIYEQKNRTVDQWMEEHRGQTLDMTEQEIGDILEITQQRVNRILPKYDIRAKGTKIYFRPKKSYSPAMIANGGIDLSQQDAAMQSYSRQGIGQINTILRSLIGHRIDAKNEIEARSELTQWVASFNSRFGSRIRSLVSVKATRNPKKWQIIRVNSVMAANAAMTVQNIVNKLSNIRLELSWAEGRGKNYYITDALEDLEPVPGPGAKRIREYFSEHFDAVDWPKVFELFDAMEKNDFPIENDLTQQEQDAIKPILLYLDNKYSNRDEMKALLKDIFSDHKIPLYSLGYAESIMLPLNTRVMTSEGLISAEDARQAVESKKAKLFSASMENKDKVFFLIKSASAAMTANAKALTINATLDNPGGIDLSQQDAALRVEKDANGGVVVNVDPALIARIEREGMSEVDPVIINMQPADVQSLFGIEASV